MCTRLSQVPPHQLVEFEHFFQTYKLLEGQDGRHGRLARAVRARELLREDREVWRVATWRTATTAGATGSGPAAGGPKAPAAS